MFFLFSIPTLTPFPPTNNIGAPLPRHLTAAELKQLKTFEEVMNDMAEDPIQAKRRRKNGEQVHACPFCNREWVGPPGWARKHAYFRKKVNRGKYRNNTIAHGCELLDKIVTLLKDHGIELDTPFTEDDYPMIHYGNVKKRTQPPPTSKFPGDVLRYAQGQPWADDPAIVRLKFVFGMEAVADRDAVVNAMAMSMAETTKTMNQRTVLITKATTELSTNCSNTSISVFFSFIFFSYTFLSNLFLHLKLILSRFNVLWLKIY